MASKKFKVIFSHYGTIDGGDACGFTRSFKLAAGLVGEKHEVVFLTVQKNGFTFPFRLEVREGVKIYAFPEVLPYAFRKGGLGSLSILLKCFFVAFTRADIVHSDTGHRPSSGIPCWVHRVFYRSKYFSEWWEHFGEGGIYDEMPRWYQMTLGVVDNYFEVRNRKRADGCLPISSLLNKRALGEDIPESKLLILNGGSDVDNIVFHESSVPSKRKFNQDINSFIICLIGINDTEFINNIDLFKSVKKLIDDNYRIKIIGTGKVDNLIMHQLGFDYSEFIHIYGWLSYEEFTALVGCADLFSLIQKNSLRNRSRFPNKLGDYLAAGRPIIANRVGEIGVYADRYPEVFHIVNESNSSIIDSIILAYKNWENGAVDYGTIRKIAVENSWRERAKELSKFYEKVCYN